MSNDLIRIPPYFYIHVQDRNLNVTRLECGPQNFTKQNHETIITGKIPINYIFLQPQHYCLINDPVMRDADNKLIFEKRQPKKGAKVDAKDENKFQQVKVNIGDSEIRSQKFYPEPFPLYPGESLTKIEKLPIVPRDAAIKLEAVRDFVAEDGKKVRAGDEWIEFGPKIFQPRIEVKIVQVIRPETILCNQALKVRANRQTKDSQGKDRQAGEEWLIREIGFYIPGIDETICEMI